MLEGHRTATNHPPRAVGSAREFPELGYREIIINSYRVLYRRLQGTRSILDLPLIEPVIVEDADGEGPFGARGIGEPPILAMAPAIANAIYDAVGVRMTSLPITAEKVLQALREREPRMDADERG